MKKNAPLPDHLSSGHAGAFESREGGLQDQLRETIGEPTVADEEETGKYEKKFSYYIPMREHPDPGRRWKAAGSLARQGDNLTIAPPIQGLSDGDRRVRQKTCQGARGTLGTLLQSLH
jgi:hypothetical protein